MKLRRLRQAVVSALLAVSVSQLEAQTNQAVFTDALQNGWVNWSWAVTSNTTVLAQAGGKSLAVMADAWEAAYFHHDVLDARYFTNLVLWLHGGAAGGQRLLVQGMISGAAQTATNLPALTANTWRQFVIPLSALGVAGAPDFDGFWIQDRSGATQPPFYVDEIVLLGATPPPMTNGPVVVTVDAARDRHAISEGIYGVAFATSNQLRELNCPLHRSGGNSESRYNWQLNAHNRGSDWYFESLSDGSAAAGQAADQFVADSRAGGSEVMLTVPMVGWVARLGPNRERLASYSIQKYGPQTDRDAQWFPDAGNGVRSSDGAAITWNDPNDANVPASASIQRGWIEHLTNRWGRAAQGGVRYYFMDNEPSLWHSTHRDVHPTGASMREVRDKFLAHAAMVKSVDPTARVAGPEEWGWSGYFWSGFDQQAGATNGWSRFPDRGTNGGWDYLPWFLDQARQRATNTGQRLLDVFTVHYYPQGGEYSDTISTAMQSRRNRSTRALWDTNYVDETWIADKVMLLPRLKSWVAGFYPGTAIGVTEYSWGADGHINGATAQADLLGIFGRENLDLAVRWVCPASNTPAYHAIRMYRNYDGHRSTFGDISVPAAGSNPDDLAAFAAVRSGDGALTVMIIHKQLGLSAPVTIALTNYPAAAAAEVWQLTASNRITRLADLPVAGARIETVVPAQSLTLLVVPAAPPPRLEIRARFASNAVELLLFDAAGRRCIIQHSANLTGWRNVLTNTASASGLPIRCPVESWPGAFYRAMLQQP